MMKLFLPSFKTKKKLSLINHSSKGNQSNQVGLMGISIIGKVKENNNAGGLNRRKTEADLETVPRRQDLAFLMYTDKDVAEVN